MAIEFWIKATLLICCYGFFKEMKPSEPFLTPFLKGPPKNLTEEELDNEIYPVWTYSYLIALVVVFLFTDILRYKPVIIVEGLAYLTTRVLLIWASGVLSMQFMQFAYGVATGAEVAYYSYIYAVVSHEHYQKVTSYTRAAVLVGRMISGVVGQLLISFNVVDYLALNYISLASVSLAFVFALVLPKASGNVFGLGVSDPSPDLGEGLPLQGSRTGCCKVHLRLSHFFRLTYLSWKKSMLDLWHDFKLCYSKRQLLIWSLWWAFATCGEFQVENYAQNLWDVIYPSKHHKIYNGGVTAISHLVASGVALALAFVKVNWSLFGELCLAVVSIADAFFLYITARTSSIWLAYLMYILFRIAYTFLITIASVQIARNVDTNQTVGMSRFALVFGCNMFAALLLQTILTAIVVEKGGLNLDVKTQFVIYGSYFFLIGAVFLARAVYTMTRTGWRRCWDRRYYTEDTQILQDYAANTSTLQEDVQREAVDSSVNEACVT